MFTQQFPPFHDPVLSIIFKKTSPSLTPTGFPKPLLHIQLKVLLLQNKGHRQNANFVS